MESMKTKISRVNDRLAMLSNTCDESIIETDKYRCNVEFSLKSFNIPIEDKLKAIKALFNIDVKAFKEYDKDGNIIRLRENYDGIEYEEWFEYDDRGNMIHCKNSFGLESWKEYNENNRTTHYKDSNGKEWFIEYGEDGKINKIKHSNGKDIIIRKEEK